MVERNSTICFFNFKTCVKECSPVHIDRIPIKQWQSILTTDPYLTKSSQHKPSVHGDLLWFEDSNKKYRGQ